MKRTASCVPILSCLLALLGGCERYPSKLPPAEQVQALIYMDLATNLYQATSADDSAYPLFLCYGDPLADPSPAVLAFVARSFASARMCSATAPRTVGPVTERATGREGQELRISPFTIESQGPLALHVETWGGGKNGVAYEYQLQRVNARWQYVKREKLWTY